jgi:enamine deaminase RidA (YjgF/YER057c/UK114 family)
VTLELAQAAARLCALNVLAQVKAAVVGDWSRVRGCVRLCGYVSSAPGFYEQPKVLDGASDLIVAALGDAGKHARSAMGAFALRGNVPVVIDAIFELAD